MKEHFYLYLTHLYNNPKLSLKLLLFFNTDSEESHAAEMSQQSSYGLLSNSQPVPNDCGSEIQTYRRRRPCDSRLVTATEEFNTNPTISWLTQRIKKCGAVRGQMAQGGTVLLVNLEATGNRASATWAHTHPSVCAPKIASSVCWAG